MKVRTQAGGLGQFDVVVDGEVVASRGGGVFQRLFGGGWPDPEAVVRAIEERLQAKP